MRHPIFEKRKKEEKDEVIDSIDEIWDCGEWNTSIPSVVEVKVQTTYDHCDSNNNSKPNQAVNVPQIVIINMISPPHYHQLKLIWINNHNLFVFSMMIPVPYWLSVVWWLFLLWFVNSGDCGRFIYVYTSIYNVCLLLRSIECVVCCFDSIQVTLMISFVFCMNNTTGTNTLVE